MLQPGVAGGPVDLYLENSLRESPGKERHRETETETKRHGDQEGLISMTWFSHLNSDKPVVILSLASFSKLFNYHSK